MSLRDILSRYWRGFQPELYEAVEETVGSLSDRYRLLLDVFEFVRVEKLIGPGFGMAGRRRIVFPWRMRFWPRRFSTFPRRET